MSAGSVGEVGGTKQMGCPVIDQAALSKTPDQADIVRPCRERGMVPCHQEHNVLNHKLNVHHAAPVLFEIKNIGV